MSVFETMKAKLVSNLVLSYPSLNEDDPFVFNTDASDRCKMPLRG